MASSRETNTMAEGLQRIMGEIAKMKTMPDSDIDYLNQVESGIIDYLRPPDPNQQPQGGGMPGMGAPGGMPGMPPMGGGGMPPGMPSPGAIPGGGAPPGLMGQAPSMPAINPDELRRVLNLK